MARYEEPSANEDVFSEMIQVVNGVFFFTIWRSVMSWHSFRGIAVSEKVRPLRWWKIPRVLMVIQKFVFTPVEFLSDVSEVLSGPAEKVIGVDYG